MSIVVTSHDEYDASILSFLDPGPQDKDLEGVIGRTSLGRWKKHLNQCGLLDETDNYKICAKVSKVSQKQTLELKM